MKIKIRNVLLLILVLFLFLVGCSNNSTNTIPKEKNEQTKGNPTPEATQKIKENKPAKLSILWWGSQERHEKTLKVIDNYISKNNHIKFEPEYTGWSGYWDKLATLVASGEAPDIFQMDYSYIKKYTVNNSLADLTQYIGKELDITHIQQSTLNSGVINDKLVGVPLGINAMAMVYDPEIFKRANVPLPEDSWTWDDYINAATKIHEKTGIWGAALYNKDMWEYYLRQNGASLYSKDGSSIGYDDDSLFIDFHQRGLELQKRGISHPPEAAFQIQGLEDHFIVRGQEAMRPFWSNQITALVRAANRQLKLALLPGATQKPYGMYLKPSMFFSVYSNSKNIEQCVEFINFFVNDVEANLILSADRGVPISSLVRNEVENSLEGIVKDIFNYINLVEAYSSTIDPPPPEGASLVNDVYFGLEEEMSYEVVSVKEAAVKFRNQANKELERAKTEQN